jgi:hypothetical protein
MIGPSISMKGMIVAKVLMSSSNPQLKSRSSALCPSGSGDEGGEGRMWIGSEPSGFGALAGPGGVQDPSECGCSVGLPCCSADGSASMTSPGLGLTMTTVECNWCLGGQATSDDDNLLQEWARWPSPWQRRLRSGKPP